MPILRANPEFLVNTSTLNFQNQSSVTALADGRFVVSWTDQSTGRGDTSGSAVHARIFNFDGTQSVSEFLVNTTTANSQLDSSVTALADGRFIVSWTDNSLSTGDTSGLAFAPASSTPTARNPCLSSWSTLPRRMISTKAA